MTRIELSAARGLLTDAHNLQRFRDAQRDVYATALTEIRAGRKRTHWMWFIFPQCAGLGTSFASEFYAIRSVADARAYLDDPLLGVRLRECADAVLTHRTRSAREIMGYPDDMKLRSSATLFAGVEGNDSVFHQIVAQFFDGDPDARTLAFIARNP